MKARVTDDCIACGLCIEACPEVFDMGEEVAIVISEVVPADVEDACKEAVDGCPVEAITVTE